MQRRYVDSVWGWFITLVACGVIVGFASGVRWGAMMSSIVLFTWYLHFCVERVIKAQDEGEIFDKKVIRRYAGILGLLLGLSLGTQAWLLSGMS